MALHTAPAYLELDGIQGNSQDEKFKDKIEVVSWHWGASNHSSASSGKGHSTSVGQIHDINVTKNQDKSSPELMLRCVSGSTIPKGTLHCVKRTGDDQSIVHMKIEFEDMFVTNYQMGGHGHDTQTENMSLAFTTMKIIYTVQADSGSPDSTIDKGWHAKENRPL